MFGCRRDTQQLNIPITAMPVYTGDGRSALLTVGPVPVDARSPNLLGLAGWAPGPGTPHPSQQIGLFAGRMLNQYPAIVPGIQRHSVREFGNSRWNVPLAVPSPLGNLSQTMNYANLPGAQRRGSQFSGLLGPINSRQVTASGVAQQIRQSGLQAMNWAAGLNPLNNTGG